MNMWIVLCQAVTFAFLLSQYLVFKEVEAEEPRTLAAGGWFGDLEKKLNVIKGVMHDVFQTIKRSALIMPLRASPHRRTLTTVQDVPTATDIMIEESTIPITNYEEITTTNNDGSCPNVKKVKCRNNNIIDMDAGNEYASGLSEENNDPYQNFESQTPQGPHKKKKKVKKNKKKIKPKRKAKPKKVFMEKAVVEKNPSSKPHVSNMYVQREFVEDTNPEIQIHRVRSHKKKAIKFVKSTVDNKLNDSESEETTKRGKPVDIIVHIKMNE